MHLFLWLYDIHNKFIHPIYKKYSEKNNEEIEDCTTTCILNFVYQALCRFIYFFNKKLFSFVYHFVKIGIVENCRKKNIKLETYTLYNFFLPKHI